MRPNQDKRWRQRLSLGWLNISNLQVHQMKFNAAGGASGEANNAAAALLAEVPPEDLLLAEWHNSIMRPCHYLALDRRRQRLVLSIRCARVLEALGWSG